jgi:hypothetical protein
VYYTDDGSSVTSSSYMLSSRAPSAHSAAASQRHDVFAADMENHSRQQQHADGLQIDSDREPTKQIVNQTPVVRRFNLFPIRSSLGPGQRRTRLTTPSHVAPRTIENVQLQKEMQNGHDCYKKMFRKLASKASSLRDAEIDKILFDSGLGDGMLSPRQIKEGSSKRTKAPAVNLTIRLSNDYASLRKLGCNEDTLSALRSIDPIVQEVEIVAETVETGDMTLLCAPPEHMLQPAPARRFAQDHRQSSIAESSNCENNLVGSADLAKSSLLRQQPARHASANGSSPPPQADWSTEVCNSPLKFSSMKSNIPRFEETGCSSPPNDSKLGIQDWTSALQGSSYSYRSVFTGPARFPDVRRDVITPLPTLQAVNRTHNRRSCTAQHKQDREPNSMLESRICATLAKEAQAPTTTERMGLKSFQERAAALEVDQIGSHYGAKDHERIRNKQERLMEVFAVFFFTFILHSVL